MSNLRRLLEQANAVPSSIAETNSFDELDNNIQELAVNSVPDSFNMGISKDGQQLQIGDPVTGLHNNQNMSGQVIAIEGDIITVEWKNRDVSRVKANTLVMTNVDDDYEEQTMYIEAQEPIPTMGFDKESFVEDTDLETLLKGHSGSSLNASFKYEANDDI